MADQTADSWTFQVEGKQKSVRVTGRFRADNTVAIYAAVAAGLGVGFTPLWQIRPLVDRGDVELVLTEYETPRAPIRIVWPASKLLAAKTPAFIDFLSERLDCRRL